MLNRTGFEDFSADAPPSGGTCPALRPAALVVPGSSTSTDPPAAEHQLILIKNAGLTRRNRALRRLQSYPRVPVAEQRHCRRCARMVVTNLGGHFQDLGWCVEGNPIAARDREFLPVEGRFVAD